MSRAYRFFSQLCVLEYVAQSQTNLEEFDDLNLVQVWYVSTQPPYLRVYHEHYVERVQKHQSKEYRVVIPPDGRLYLQPSSKSQRNCRCGDCGAWYGRGEYPSGTRLGQILLRYGIGDARHCVEEMQSYSDSYEADNDEKEEATCA